MLLRKSNRSSHAESLLCKDRLGVTALKVLQTRWTTIDGLTAGQEKEVIIFSAVRSNAQGRIGFLADVRRLNVALTRARRGLIVIGSKSTLMNNPTWR